MIDEIAARLKKKRLELGQSIDYVSTETKINSKIINALENCDLSVFTNETYILGFIKVYAKHLNVNIEDLTANFKETIKSYNSEIYTPESVFQDSMPSFNTLIISLLLVLVIYIIWYTMFYLDSTDILFDTLSISIDKL